MIAVLVSSVNLAIIQCHIPTASLYDGGGGSSVFTPGSLLIGYGGAAFADPLVGSV